MNLLLDTCTLIWLASEPERLGAEAAAVIDDPASVLHQPRQSVGDAVKHGAGKLSLPDSPRVWWGEQAGRSGLIELSLTTEALLAGGELPAHHKDPFDRVVLAQAQIAGLRVVSPDGAFPAYGVPLIW